MLCKCNVKINKNITISTIAYSNLTLLKKAELLNFDSPFRDPFYSPEQDPILFSPTILIVQDRMINHKNALGTTLSAVDALKL